jgi:hypothetical protein
MTLLVLLAKIKHGLRYRIQYLFRKNNNGYYTSIYKYLQALHVSAMSPIVKSIHPLCVFLAFELQGIPLRRETQRRANELPKFIKKC